MKKNFFLVSFLVVLASSLLANTTTSNDSGSTEAHLIQRVASNSMSSPWVKQVGLQYSMPILARVYKNATLYQPTGSLLGVFKNNLCWGYGGLGTSPVGPLYNITTGYNTTPVTGFSYKVYDPTTGKIYDLVETVTFTSNVPVGAINAPITLNVKFAITATSADINKGTVSGSVGTFTSGQSVNVIATPIAGYRFVSWTDGVGGTVMSTNADYTFSANESRSLIANFDVATITISTSTNASSLTSCPTCDLTIENNGHLVIDANSTYNNIIIQGGAKLTINNGYALSASTLNINSAILNGTGTLVDNNASGGLTVTGSTNVQQYLTAGRNWYISSPVSNANSSVFNATSNILYYYDEASASWPQIINNSTALTVAKGYVANMTSSAAVTFNGTLNTGIQQISITRHPGVAKEGFNLVGNPYPSFLNFESALQHVNTSNLGNSFWFRTQNEGKTSYVFDSYSTLNHIGTSNNNNSLVGITADIPPMQAFWVRVADGKTTANLTFNNSMRSHKDQSIVPNRFKAPTEITINEQMVRLQVSNGMVSDEAILITNPSASNAYDAYDTQKMSNNSVSIPEIYTLADNEQVVINGLNSIKYDTEIALGFTTGQSNTFTIKASQISNFSAGTQVILLDKLMNKEQDLTVSDYSFSSDVTSTTSRFSLVFKAPSVATSINSTDLLGVKISSDSNNKIVVDGVVANESSVVICNTLGQRIYSSVLTSVNSTLNPELKSGVYLVTVKSTGKNVSAKVIIK